MVASQGIVFFVSECFRDTAPTNASAPRRPGCIRVDADGLARLESCRGPDPKNRAAKKSKPMHGAIYHTIPCQALTPAHLPGTTPLPDHSHLHHEVRVGSERKTITPIDLKFGGYSPRRHPPFFFSLPNDARQRSALHRCLPACGIRDVFFPRVYPNECRM